MTTFAIIFVCFAVGAAALAVVLWFVYLLINSWGQR